MWQGASQLSFLEGLFIGPDCWGPHWNTYCWEKLSGESVKNSLKIPREASKRKQHFHSSLEDKSGATLGKEEMDGVHRGIGGFV